MEEKTVQIFDSALFPPIEKVKHLLKEKKRNPRIGFEITVEQRNELKHFIPWGVVTVLYQIITEDLLELMKTHGSGRVLSAVLNRQVKFYEISKTLKQDDPQPAQTKLS